MDNIDLNVLKQMADIKPVEVFESRPDYFIYSALFFSLVIIVLILFFIWKKYFKKGKTVKNEPFLSIEKLLDEIDSLNKNNGEPLKEKWFKLSFVFRKYLYLCHGVNSFNLSEKELSQKLFKVKSLSFFHEKLCLLLEKFEENKFSSGNDDNLEDFYTSLSFLKTLIKDSQKEGDIKNV
ncbi:MAG: hypothetical protein CSA18_03715 [Deltaproteobacteria bacterium]|nr:MAG: hypothetical protein CSA18_03715 [Deltaproteobacteria bacterium]